MVAVPSASRRVAPSRRHRGLGFQGQADKELLVAEVKLGVAEDWRCPAGVGEFGDLVAGEFDGLGGGGFKEAEESAFAEDDELVVSQNRGAPAVGVGLTGATAPAFVPVPHEFS